MTKYVANLIVSYISIFLCGAFTALWFVSMGWIKP